MITTGISGDKCLLTPREINTRLPDTHTRAQISQLAEMVNEKSSTIRQLEEKLNRQKDYEAIKRELR